MLEATKPKGVFKVQVIRGATRVPGNDLVPDSYIGGEVLHDFEVENLITTAGKNHMLDVTFHGTTPVSPWYMGLINNSGFSAVAAGDTHASHAGWTETTAYDEATREAYVEDAAGSGSITNTTVCEFTINATVAVKGIFLASVSTKGDTGAGTLWCATTFTTALSLVDDDILRITYTVTLT